MNEIEKRFIGSYLILTIGSWVVSLSMAANGVSIDVRELYHFLCFARWLLTAPVALIVLCWMCLILNEAFEQQRRRASTCDEEPSFIREMTKAAAADGRQRVLEDKQLEADKIERQRQQGIAERNEAIRLELERRKSRSADEAAKSALGDF